MGSSKGQQVFFSVSVPDMLLGCPKEISQIVDILGAGQNFCNVIMLSFYDLEIPEMV